jgi:hypothetical protein
MSIAFEAFLARIYTDDGARARFLADPRGEAMRAGLRGAEVDALERVDRVGLELAAESFARKRRTRSTPASPDYSPATEPDGRGASSARRDEGAG